MNERQIAPIGFVKAVVSDGKGGTKEVLLPMVTLNDWKNRIYDQLGWNN